MTLKCSSASSMCVCAQRLWDLCRPLLFFPSTKVRAGGGGGGAGISLFPVLTL